MKVYAVVCSFDNELSIKNHILDGKYYFQKEDAEKACQEYNEKINTDYDMKFSHSPKLYYKVISYLQKKYPSIKLIPGDARIKPDFQKLVSDCIEGFALGLMSLDFKMDFPGYTKEDLSNDIYCDFLGHENANEGEVLEFDFEQQETFITII